MNVDMDNNAFKEELTHILAIMNDGDDKTREKGHELLKLKLKTIKSKSPNFYLVTDLLMSAIDSMKPRKTVVVDAYSDILCLILEINFNYRDKIQELTTRNEKLEKEVAKKNNMNNK